MKLLILIMIFASFIQTSVLSLNLLLLIILIRSLLIEEKANYLLAFSFGLFLGILSSHNIGFWPIIFIFTVKVANLVRRLPFSANLLTILPSGVIIIFSVHLLESFVFNKSLQTNYIIIESLLITPLYIFIKAWEERFIIRNDIKLKIKS